MKRGLFSPETKTKKRKKKNKRRELDIMRKNMDPKKFKLYLMQKIKLLKRELELNANVLRKNPTKIVAKIRQAELKAKLEETVRYIPRKAPQVQRSVNSWVATRATPKQIASYRKFVRRTVRAAPRGYMTKEALLEKLLEEFELTKAWLFRELGISDFAQFLKKESSVFVDFYGYVNSKLEVKKKDKTTKALKKGISAKVMKRFNAIFDDKTDSIPKPSPPSVPAVPSKPSNVVDVKEAQSQNRKEKVKVWSSNGESITSLSSLPIEVSTATLAPSIGDEVHLNEVKTVEGNVRTPMGEGTPEEKLEVKEF